VQRDLAEVGIRAEIIVMEWNAYLGMWFNGVPAAEGGKIPIHTQAMGWDTNQLLGSYIGSGNQPPNGVNFVWYANSEVDKLLEQSRAETTYDGMIQKLRDAQKLMLEERPYVYIFHSKAPYAMNNRVHWVPAAAWAQNLRQAWVSP
jgi:ABC-type transport system substrate-binding protein